MTARPNLELLLDALASSLLDKVKSGEATAADLNVARQMLKDNGISAIPTDSNPLGKLKDALPFQSTEEIAADQEPYH